MSMCQSRSDRSTLKQPVRRRRAEGRCRCSNPSARITPLGPLARDRSTQLPAREGYDHAGALRGVRPRELDDRAVDRPRGLCFVARQIAWREICIARAVTATVRPRATSRRGRGDALSLPASQCSPRDLELVGLAADSALQLADLLRHLLLAPAPVLTLQGGLAALEGLVVPVVVDGSETSSSRQTSLTDRSPHIPASTISSFYWTLRCSRALPTRSPLGRAAVLRAIQLRWVSPLMGPDRALSFA